MKELYSKYINEIKSKKVIFISVILLLVLGLLFGSLYITIISNEDKKYINDSVYNYFNSCKMIFKIPKQQNHKGLYVRS